MMGRPIIHGYKNHPLYGVWSAIKKKCNNKNSRWYKDYGGRGISVCDEWVNDPKIFIQWALSHGWEKGLNIDRIDNDGDYCPENCRFIDKGLSARNTRLLRGDNKTGYRGVFIGHNKNNPYQSSISVYGKKRHLGCFPSPGLAALRYDVEAFLLNDGRPMNFIDR